MLYICLIAKEFGPDAERGKGRSRQSGVEPMGYLFTVPVNANVLTI